MFSQVFSLGSASWLGVAPMLIASLALIGVAVVAVYVIRVSGKRSLVGGGDMSSEDVVMSPREILQIRYVCGEINREQYLEMLADLK